MTRPAKAVSRAEADYLSEHIPGSCIVCKNGPKVIRCTEMCGPCTFGEHDAEPLPLYRCNPDGTPIEAPK